MLFPSARSGTHLREWMLIDMEHQYSYSVKCRHLRKQLRHDDSSNNLEIDPQKVKEEKYSGYGVLPSFTKVLRYPPN